MFRDLSQFFACVILFFSAVSGWCCLFFLSFLISIRINMQVTQNVFLYYFLGSLTIKCISYIHALYLISSILQFLGKYLFLNRGRFCRGMQVFTCRRGSFLNFAMLTFFISSVSFSPTWRILMKPVMFDRLNFFPRNISWGQCHVQKQRAEHFEYNFFLWQQLFKTYSLKSLFWIGCCW